ncbi:hypothetical protein [Streptomyces hygroscopicus]|nr:hypothetical protein [Streptomyces hygroscopicus]
MATFGTNQLDGAGRSTRWARTAAAHAAAAHQLPAALPQDLLPVDPGIS